jgi:bifunctional enzyme CysN/CysC
VSRASVAPEVVPIASSEADLLRLLTAGSVDDGKSTLIGRLLYDTHAIFEDQLSTLRKDTARRGGTEDVDLALLTDGLKAEREQGITIDVAYRYFATSRRKFIIADCPGHEQYTRNMATGASNCDLAIILIDARHGVLTQTRRHSFIVSLLGIRHVVVAINKMDLVGYDERVFEEIRSAYTDFAARLEIPDIRFIPLSARLGDNVVRPSDHMPWYAGETLLNFLETAHIASDRNLIDFRFPVQYVIRPNQDFRGFAGTVASGLIRRGDDVVVLPSGARTRIQSIDTYEGRQDEAFAPQAVTLTLEDEVDVSRGDMIARPGNVPRLQESFDAMIVWMSDEALQPGRPYWIKHTTNLVQGRISQVRFRLNVNTLHREPADALQLNEVGRCVVVVNRPLAIDPYRKNRTTGGFIVIDRLTNNTVGAGMVVDRMTSAEMSDGAWIVDAAETATIDAYKPVAAEDRERRDGQRPATILLTGLPATGKTAIAYALERALFDAGYIACVLDGKQMRATVNRGLGYSAADRAENLRRSVVFAHMLNQAGLICICAFVAPSAAVREKARVAVGADRFIEVHLTAPDDVRLARMVADGRHGDLDAQDNATDTYDVPDRPDLALPTDRLTVSESVARLIQVLGERGVLQKGSGQS